MIEKNAQTISEQMNREIRSLQNGTLKNEKLVEDVVEQLGKFQSEFINLPKVLREKIQDLEKTTFSITVFGRTMAGKSTLMEILTHGSGASIGKGAQRTTRDVRTYVYQGLEITDVPGIAAFEGKDDEMIAMEAAAKSNLILFLMTDDAPQAKEAECLKQVLELGKPVICIVNIKVNIVPNGSLKLFERDLRKKFSQDRLEMIRNQFLEFGRFWGQDWHSIRFAYVHLKSAFLSQQTENEEIREQLYAASRFADVENLIIDEICQNGSFYKLKTFSDGMVVPVLAIMEELFRQSAHNSQNGSSLIKKRKELKDWAIRFQNLGRKRIEECLREISNELKEEAISFAEDNYDNSAAGIEWEQVMKRQDITKRTNDLLIQLNNDCYAEIQEISRQIHKEIEFNHQILADYYIRGEDIFDIKRWIGWGTVLFSVASLFTPIGILGTVLIGLGGTLFSWFFEDKQKKIQRARKKLQNRIFENIDKNIETLKEQMNRIFEDEIVNKNIWKVIDEIDANVNSFFILSRVQRNFAISLNHNLQRINRTLINSALDYLNCFEAKDNILNIARVPGIGIMFLLRAGEEFPSFAARKLSELLKEKIWFVIDTGKLKSILIQAIWPKKERQYIDKDSIRIQYIDDKPQISHIPFIEKRNVNIRNRVRLAQQLTELLIMK